MAGQAVLNRLVSRARRRCSPRITRRTASHSVKKGVRYRYYVSQAILGSRPGEAGRVGRVSAPDLEALIEGFLRKRFAAAPGQGLAAQALVAAHLHRATLLYDAIDLGLTDSQGTPTETVRLAWQHKPFAAEKGPTAELPPAAQQDPKARDACLVAIGKAWRWLDELSDGASFTAIAQREGKCERQIRLLLPLAFLSPQVVRDVADGSGPIGTVTDLTRNVPMRWPIVPELGNVRF